MAIFSAASVSILKSKFINNFAAGESVLPTVTDALLRMHRRCRIFYKLIFPILTGSYSLRIACIVTPPIVTLFAIHLY